MPYQFDTPEIVEVQRAVPEHSTVAHVVELHFDLPPRPSNMPSLRVVLSKGTGEGDGYIEHERVQYRIDVEELMPPMLASVTSGNSRYTEIKAAVYALLQARGALPAGIAV